jgi:CRP-like cAMP-binding protein
VAYRDGIGTLCVPVLAVIVLQVNTMPTAPPLPLANLLLGKLPKRESHKLIAQCETVELTFGNILCERGDRFDYVYFPLSGFISLVSQIEGHPPLEMGLIGNEGMLGVMLALGIDRVPLRGVVQGPGEALRMSAGNFRKALNDSQALSRSVFRYLYSTYTQVTQTATCNRFHEVEARLSRWLLMTHDRAHCDHFHLTHHFLADMLGVQRSAVTIAAGALQHRGLIHYSRGEINILDRKGLEASSCECYARMQEVNLKVLA